MRLPLLLLGGVLLMVPACQMPEPIRVMSFNVRYGTASDGDNAWEHRRELVFTTIRDHAPDVLGLQEVLDWQLDELHAALDDYEYVGFGRDDGKRAGEFAPILYNKRTFRLVEGGQVWLSETPSEPGSVGWDAVLPRVVTWAELAYRKSPQNTILVFNTHFDHAGETARLESARLIRRMVEVHGGEPVILTGDFNCTPGSRPFDVLTEDRGNLTELRDTLAVVEGEDSGTYHGFTGRPTGGRIDWILCNRRFVVLEAGIVRQSAHGRYPSDHFPVTATVELQAATRFGGM